MLDADFDEAALEAEAHGGEEAAAQLAAGLHLNGGGGADGGAEDRAREREAERGREKWREPERRERRRERSASPGRWASPGFTIRP